MLVNPAMLIDTQVIISLGNAFILGLPPMIIAITGLVVAIKSISKTAEVKTLVNGRMDELLQMTKEKAHHEGKLSGYHEALEKTLQPGVQEVFDKTFRGREITIRDKATNAILCRRHSDDPEVLDALNDPTKVVES